MILKAKQKHARILVCIANGNARALPGKTTEGNVQESVLDLTLDPMCLIKRLILNQ